MADFGGLLFRRGVELIQAMEVASGVVIDIGDMLRISGGVVEPCAATTDNLTFIGIAKEAHGASDPATKVSVAIRNAGAIYLANLDAATAVVFGDLLQMNTTTPAKVLTKSTTDAVAMALQQGTLSQVEVMFSLPATTALLRLVGDAS